MSVNRKIIFHSHFKIRCYFLAETPADEAFLFGRAFAAFFTGGVVFLSAGAAFLEMGMTFFTTSFVFFATVFFNPAVSSFAAFLILFSNFFSPN